MFVLSHRLKKTAWSPPHLEKPSFDHQLVVPPPPCLLQPIQLLPQPHDPFSAVCPYFLIPRWLPHEYYLFFGEFSIQICAFDVDLTRFIVFCGRKRKNCANRR